ncbi:MAG: prenyltransferase/squalene oxidase repeat-containing protein [Candidatus Paceibacterota bacterium]
MKNIKKILYLSFILISLPFHIFAEDITPEVIPPTSINIHLTISTNTSSIYDKNIDVEACNSDNASTTELKVTAYCAILQSGIQNDWNWSWPPGAFLNSLNDISGYTSKDKDDKDVYHYWSWSLNSTEGTVGLNQYELKPNDLISLKFIDPIEPDPVIPPPLPEPEPTPEPTPEPIVIHRGGGRPTFSAPTPPPEKIKFDLKKATDFIFSQQKEDGSFGENLYTDWASLAIASDISYPEQKIKLTKYLSENNLPDSSLITDYERHSMSLMALGINPYNVNNENYIKKILDSYDGKQFGNVEEDNDDIFALIVLQNAGYTKEDNIIKDTVTYIISKQKENGSWNDNVDMTGAVIQTLAFFNNEKDPLPTSPLAGGGEISNALIKAKEFLKQNQKDDGGFGNVSSTAWAIGGITALSEKPEDWTKNNNTPLDYLGAKQDTDGGIKNTDLQSKIWETSYVIAALSQKTWNQIMQKFEKPEEILPSTSNSISPSPGEGEKPIITKNTIKKPSKTTKTQTLQDLASQNTATVINSLEENNLQSTKKSWFRNLLDKIFSFF